MRSAQVFFKDQLAGQIRETEGGMEFEYAQAWLTSENKPAIALTLPKRPEPYVWKGPSPFFMGLLPEGWLHTIALDTLKISTDDWFGQIISLCHDCIGAVHIGEEGIVQ